jgi:hypothetical protein
MCGAQDLIEFSPIWDLDGVWDWGVQFVLQQGRGSWGLYRESLERGQREEMDRKTRTGRGKRCSVTRAGEPTRWRRVGASRLRYAIPPIPIIPPSSLLFPTPPLLSLPSLFLFLPQTPPALSPFFTPCPPWNDITHIPVPNTINRYG